MKQLIALSPDQTKRLFKSRTGDNRGDWGFIEENEIAGAEEPLFEILRKSDGAWIPIDEDPERIIDQVYLPFPAKVLDKHLAKPESAVESPTDETNTARDGLNYYLKSARRYRLFKATGASPEALGLSRLRQPCQIEKDERFWTAACMLQAFTTNRFPGLLEAAFGSSFSPVDGTKWDQLIGKTPILWLEKPLPSPHKYKVFLASQYRKERGRSDQFGLVPYVWTSAKRSINRLEGFTHADSVLENQDGLRIIFEAKATSDISTDVAFDLMRNQIARNIDAGLLGDDARNIESSHLYFVLVTPEIFRRYPESRLYGWAMAEYMHPLRGGEALKKALPHRDDITDRQWEAVRRKLAWMTWEDCTKNVPGACPWLEI